MKRHLLLLAVLIGFQWTISSAQTNGKKVFVYSTSKNSSDRIRLTDTVIFKDLKQPLEADPCIFIDPKHSFQTFIGIGGALTDASAETFAKLSKTKQQEFLQACFDPAKGIGYTLGRTHIHSCDFSSGSYTYVTNEDPSLKTFSVAHDKQYRIPFIKQAIAAAGGSLTLFASPWSPPAFMKDNNNMLQGGHLLPEFMQAWADYYIRFINAYQQEGIRIWGLTVQNEPMAKQRWESCIYTADEERDFIKNYLGPTLQKNGMADKKLIAWDHNRDLAYQRAATILNDPAAAKYVWGIGFHWYEWFMGGSMQFDNIRKINEAFPGKNLIFTEGCADRFDISKVDDWTLGERYGHSMVNDFNCGTAAWTDWNVLLDEQGGPNHVANYCFAPIIADTRKDELIYTNSYYYIGHFSKFIRPGAKRIATSSNRDELEATAFKNKDGKIVVVVMNRSEKDIPYHVWMDGRAIELNSRSHSIVSIVM